MTVVVVVVEWKEAEAAGSLLVSHRDTLVLDMLVSRTVDSFRSRSRL
jgi:hypothetical protein